MIDKQTINPNFNWIYQFIINIPILLIMTLIFRILIGYYHATILKPFIVIISFLAKLEFFRIAYSSTTILMIHAVVVYLLFLLFKLIFYKQVRFSLKENSIQYALNFVFENKKSIFYQGIKEVTLHRGVIQRLFGLGTVKVTTHATTQDAGIKMVNIKEYQEVYNLLMQKVQG